MKKVFSVFLVLSLVSCVSFQDRSIMPAMMESFEVVGYIDISFTTYQFLHIRSNGSIKKKAYDKLLAEAKRRYSGNIDVINISAQGSFNGLTLLVPLPIYGFIFSNFQTVRATGTVVRPSATASAGATQKPQEATSRTRTETTTAIGEAVNRASETLIYDLPRNSTVAILYIDSRNRELGEFAMEELEFQMVASRKFRMVDRQTLDTVREEQKFQLSGEVSDASAVSIGNMLGASIVITGSITGSGNTQRLTVKALDVKTAQIVSMARESF